MVTESELTRPVIAQLCYIIAPNLMIVDIGECRQFCYTTQYRIFCNDRDSYKKKTHVLGLKPCVVRNNYLYWYSTYLHDPEFRTKTNIFDFLQLAKNLPLLRYTSVR